MSFYGTRIGRAMLGVCACAALAASAQADIVNIVSDVSNSTEGLGTFEGTIDYNYNNMSMVGELAISLTNTGGTDDGQGAGFITGIVFNIASMDPAASATLISAGDYPFLDTAAESAMPFGNPFDAGAALGADWEGGGNPNFGIGGGETGVFNFLINASDASSLTAASFLGGPFDFNFIVRFRGFDGGGSDKVPAIIPGPAALALLGLAGVRSRRRR